MHLDRETLPGQVVAHSLGGGGGPAEDLKRVNRAVCGVNMMEHVVQQAHNIAHRGLSDGVHTLGQGLYQGMYACSVCISTNVPLCVYVCVTLCVSAFVSMRDRTVASLGVHTTPR